MKVLALTWSCLLLTCFSFSARGEDLKLNFTVLGEGNCLSSSLGFGSLTLDVTTYTSGISSGVTHLSRIRKSASAPWELIGGFAALPAPPTSGWWVLDHSFSVPVTLPIGSNQLNVKFTADSARMVLDFADAVSHGAANPGNPLAFDPRRQGLSLTSITLSDGSPLSSAGLAAVFIRPETGLNTHASDTSIDEDSVVFNPGAVVVSQMGTGYARAEAGTSAASEVLHYAISNEPYGSVADDAYCFIRNRNGAVYSTSAENFAIYRLRTDPTTVSVAQVRQFSGRKDVTLRWTANAQEGFAIQRSFDLVNWTYAEDFVLAVAGTNNYVASIDESSGPVTKVFFRLVANPYLLP